MQQVGNELATQSILVSLVVPVYNEEKHIQFLLESLVQQDIPDPIEILLVDGGSTDSTMSLAKQSAELLDSPTRSIRLLNNPKRRAPSAMNVGIAAARGEFIGYFGAHATYDANYLSCCVNLLRGSDQRIACGGVIRTSTTSARLNARLVVDVLSNSFASSRSSFRTQQAGPVDNIPFPVMSANDIHLTGPYNEDLARNEDNEYNSRLRKNGVELIITDETSATYYPVDTVRRLTNYAFRNGWWNMRTIALGFDGLKSRHFIPSVFTLIIAISLVAAFTEHAIISRIGFTGLAGSIGSHLLVGLSFTLKTSGLTRGIERLILAPIILLFHLAYGLGTLAYPFVRREKRVE